MMIRKIKANNSSSGLVEHFVETDTLNFTAYFDQSEKNLLFVLDRSNDSISPNTRLILSREDDSRSWDDILSQDYKVDLEKIRPKEGHLYQPLDIEYENLFLYKSFLENSENDLAAKRLKLNREKQALDHTIKRLDEETDTLHKSQQTVMSSRKSVEDYTNRLNRLKQRKKAMEKKKKENPKSISPEKEARLENSLDRNNEAVKSRVKRLHHAEKRVEKAKEHIIEIKERLHNIKERLGVYKEDELYLLAAKPKVIEVSSPQKEEIIDPPSSTLEKPSALPHTPQYTHFWDIEISEHEIHIFHLLSLILIGLLLLLFIVIKVS
ncbi:MAG: hypothetical protein JXR30_03910 [Alphaproteobacteria bacterium]|nr:hypothetical protein [Alphaproteobacteria bacterium]